MHILSIQGIQAGAGASTCAANIARMLRELNQNVVVFDLNPNNILRLHFNMDWQESAGWAANICDGKDWHEAAYLCEQGVHFLPFGQLDDQKYQYLISDVFQENRLTDYLNALDLPDGTWVLLNVPSELNSLSRQALSLSHIIVRVFEPSVAYLSHLISSMQSSYIESDITLSNKSFYILNKLIPSSEIDQDMVLIYKQRLLKKLVPVTIHFDEYVKEAFAHKTTVNAHAPMSAAAKEFRSIAIWLMSYFSR